MKVSALKKQPIENDVSKSPGPVLNRLKRIEYRLKFSVTRVVDVFQ